MDDTPRLACQRCKQRKLRCDKGAPCSACRATGLACQVVQRARLPRGKSGKKQTQKQSLDTRLKQLEALLDQHPKVTATALGCTGNPDSQPVQNHLLAQDFWSSLSESIAGVREILEDSRDEHEDAWEEDIGRHVESGNTAFTNAALLFPEPQCHGSEPPTPSPAISATLFELFRDRVDTVYKVVHLPTILALITAPGNRTASVFALKYSMYFMAICTMKDNEVEAMGLGPRIGVIGSYRAAAEHFLERSDLLRQPDLNALQALVIYMIGLRTCLNSATTWTLVALAARIATAMRLGDEDPSSFTAPELDARRRVLYAIGVLDTHAALDRGTIPILPASAFRAPPLHIDDSDLGPGVSAENQPLSTFTDMTHSMMTYQAMLCQRKMYDLSRGGLSTWSERLQLVLDFGTHIGELAQQIGNSRVPMHMLIVASGRKIHRSLELLLLRPPYRQSIECVPSWDGLDIMLVAIEVLELHLEIPPPELEPWAWKNWVQWHALAVLLAELLTRPSYPLADRAFEVASNAYRYYARVVADSQSGMLWKPIARLMRRLKHARQTSDASSYVRDTRETGVVTVLDYATTKAYSTDNLPSFEPFAESRFKEAVEKDGCESNTFGFEPDQHPRLAWDEFLKEITDTSLWT